MGMGVCPETPNYEVVFSDGEREQRRDDCSQSASEAAQEPPAAVRSN